ncbi:MAG: hypothetical protein GVY19_08470 [Bacteroidetes bacterium]|nr:hypothetical protein [Bacteroidota bacterium]
MCTKGRTVSEFILGEIILPTLFSFLWMSIPLGAALNLQNPEIADISTSVEENVSTALFAIFKRMTIIQ